MDIAGGSRRLYYDNAYERQFDGVVTGSGRDERGAYILLDQTLFFPEGGGQPSDRGTINGIRVKDVQLAGGQIRHYIDGFAAGDEVHGEIDWDFRFDLMQQHSGEHIVSGMIHEKFGYDNVGFHMGEEFITIDLNGEISKDQLSELEAEANAYIWTNRKTRAFFATEEEKVSLPYRSKLELTGEVRIVEFPGADLCACCGLHVNYTGEIGLIKLVSVHHFRSGVRIEMLSGKRAFAFLNTHCGQNSRIAALLSVKPDGTCQALQKIQKDAYELQGRLLALEKEKYQMIADRCSGLDKVLVLVRGLSPADVRKCADAVLDVSGGICVLMSGDDRTGYRYAAGVRDGDIRDLVKAINKELSGRGGGKPVFAQGSVQGKLEDINRFFETRGYTIVK
ncbi:MAG: alanyl-tRNA editing protein [Eubacterium sp.]|nr:alanyl-tRNA editing protein [Eubacterium sp.]